MMQDRSSRPIFPTLQFAILSLYRIGEPLALTSIPLYLPALLKSLQVAEHNVPYWASICISSYAVSLCLSAPAWGWAADRWGRKPTILLASLLQILALLLFGSAQTLVWPVGMCGVLGFASANSGTLRTVAAELVPWEELQPKAFGILPMMWNIGSILGPMLGGLLADPASQYPKLFGGNKFLISLPWLLPNLVICTILFIGLVSGIFFLEETLHPYAQIQYRSLQEPEDLLSEKSQPPAYQLNPPASKPQKYRLLTTQSTLNLVANALLVTHSMIYDEFLPLFMVTNRSLILSRLPSLLPSRRSETLHISGGLGLQSQQISTYFTITAIYAVFIQLTLFPFLASPRRLGTLGCFKASAAMFPFVYFLVPFLVLIPMPIPSSSVWGTGAVLLLLLAKATITTFSFPCSMILLSRSATSPGVLGTLNGLATSSSALCRGVGALVFGRLLTRGLETGSVVLPWWVVAGIAVLGAVPIFWMIDKEDGGKKVGKEWGEDDLGREDDAGVRLLDA
ncbi:major facilitator superfamily domain-containing protein [Clohesyomyces aquaticus]|uniref:Major facilitator superfamily domain-containing protein n=1 Tax=Clohesyomyces aquaticus TaxID=1231657 RepID=A0A1Y1YN64_9PLEO|nr:major facilitator superfamily domain-containing protein [Clohesyomyces aquaticus]